jgi:HAD superfamily hydrolase (TIGR01484 family)
MKAVNLVLATDLDGTFLGGSPQQRGALYDHLAQRDDAMVIFVTGRDIGFIRELITEPGMVRPRYIVGDVGTSVFDGETFEPVAELEAHIAERWNGANERVMNLLDGEAGLRLQDTPFRHRVSYDYDPAVLSPRTVAKVEALGFDCLLSASRFFDVLPRGVSKGPTLTRLVETLGLPRGAVLVAGDTMNDLSLFQTGFRGVAVGNSEPRLKAAVQGLPNVHCSRSPGAAGIADALVHFELEGARSHEKVIAGHRLSSPAE